jgi:hypothetical protein
MFVVEFRGYRQLLLSFHAMQNVCGGVQGVQTTAAQFSCDAKCLWWSSTVLNQLLLSFHDMQTSMVDVYCAQTNCYQLFMVLI